MNDIIIAAYDYTIPDSGGRISSAVLQKFKVNDFDEGSYEAGKELELRFQIRFMRRIDDFILLCSTDSNPGQIYRISCKSGSLTLCQPDVIHEISVRRNINLRALDAVRWNEKDYLYAAAGDAGDMHIVEIWSDDCHTAVYPDFERSISSVCFCREEGGLYLFAASYDANLIVYEIKPDKTRISVQLCCICCHSDQILNMQVHHQRLYVSLLSGEVFCWNIPDILHQGKKIYEENEAQALFRAVSGFFFIFTCIVPQSCGTWPPFSLGRLMIKVLLKFTEIHIDLSVDYRNNNTSDRRVFFKKSLGGIWACLHLFHTIAVLVRTDVVCGCTAFHAVI